MLSIRLLNLENIVQTNEYFLETPNITVKVGDTVYGEIIKSIFNGYDNIVYKSNILKSIALIFKLPLIFSYHEISSGSKEECDNITLLLNSKYKNMFLSDPYGRIKETNITTSDNKTIKLYFSSRYYSPFDEEKRKTIKKICGTAIKSAKRYLEKIDKEKKYTISTPRYVYKTQEEDTPFGSMAVIEKNNLPIMGLNYEFFNPRDRNFWGYTYYRSFVAVAVDKKTISHYKAKQIPPEHFLRDIVNKILTP